MQWVPAPIESQSRMTFIRWLWLVLFLVLERLSFVTTQASKANPFIWQVVATYNSSHSTNAQNYNVSTSVKVYSQDFQTIFIDNDLYGHNERLLVDFGDGCPGNTAADLSSIYPSAKNQQSIVLIRRGGRCESWLEKVRNVQNLSVQDNLMLDAVIIYDNITDDTIPLDTLNTTDANYPTWPTPLPNHRNATLMSDNDVATDKSIYTAVYFIPHNYAQQLLNAIQQYKSQSSDSMLYFMQITPFFSEATFSTGDVDANTADDNGDSDMWSAFTGNKSYLVYLIAAGAAFVLGIICLRWCRNSRTPPRPDEEQEGAGISENQIFLQHMLQSRTRRISLNHLNTLCPVHDYTGTSKNTICAICLEDLKEVGSVRTLPCEHVFCVACIDVWLTKKSTLCPICKYDCGEDMSEEDNVNSVSNESTDSASSPPAPPRAPEGAVMRDEISHNREATHSHPPSS
ncbi:hypothetical protein BCR43DRAFT_304 [Syncephalastrum racemosum]|uniref:RING-type domain-containing protein n=1 Tax=Syncephalastrum racemosum TaxID=13706 RepID=A0A1X2HSQ2_SYNRA|nr:hypothetical protein BCR43DRAFT_304 [Syncephalastrum racemosum]